MNINRVPTYSYKVNLYDINFYIELLQLPDKILHSYKLDVIFYLLFLLSSVRIKKCIEVHKQLFDRLLMA